MPIGEAVCDFTYVYQGGANEFFYRLKERKMSY